MSSPVLRELWSPAAVRSHYDEMAWVYRMFWGDHIHHGLFRNGAESPGAAQIALIDECVRLAGIPDGSRVIDAGCGHGATAVYLARNHGCSVLGLTISSRQAHFAEEKARRARVGNRVKIECCDVEHYEFPPADVVLAIESTEHFRDRLRFLLKVSQALRPGGRLVIAAWTGSMEDSLIRVVAQRLLCNGLWRADDYVQNIEGSGLKCDTVRDLTTYVSRTWDICANRAHRLRFLSLLLPRAAVQFYRSIGLMQAAYASGKLRYTVIAARKGAL